MDTAVPPTPAQHREPTTSEVRGRYGLGPEEGSGMAHYQPEEGSGMAHCSRRQYNLSCRGMTPVLNLGAHAIWLGGQHAAGGHRDAGGTALGQHPTADVRPLLLGRSEA